MSRHIKPGRNDLCACGSGKKFKQCCEKKSPGARRSWVLLGLVLVAVIGGIAAGVLSFGETSSTSPMAGTVWSPEHGHFH